LLCILIVSNTTSQKEVVQRGFQGSLEAKSSTFKSCV